MPKPVRAPAKGRESTPPPGLDSLFAAASPAVRERLVTLRRLILDTAAATPGVGRIDEALKWGQPSFLTSETGSGSTIRIDALKTDPAGYAVYFHCQTDLVDTFRRLYPDKFRFEGNRAIHLDAGQEPPAAELKHCIALALTYHLRKRR
jgi:hypothetical protein